MNRNSILIVEDDKALNQHLVEYMENYFENIYTAFDGESAYESYLKHEPAVIISDIHLPKSDGLEFITKIRENDDDTKVIILSAHTDKEKLFKAIELNLITYLVKPIKSDELQKAILNAKKQLEKKYIIQISEKYFFDTQTNQLYLNKEEVSLTLQEKKFLSLLLQRKNNSVSYEDISLHVYEFNEFSQNAITSLVKRLRKKLDDEIIKTSFKIGYKIETYK